MEIYAKIPVFSHISAVYLAKRQLKNKLAKEEKANQ